MNPEELARIIEALGPATASMYQTGMDRSGIAPAAVQPYLDPAAPQGDWSIGQALRNLLGYSDEQSQQVQNNQDWLINQMVGPGTPIDWLTGPNSLAGGWFHRLVGNGPVPVAEPEAPPTPWVPGLPDIAAALGGQASNQQGQLIDIMGTGQQPSVAPGMSLDGLPSPFAFLQERGTGLNWEGMDSNFATRLAAAIQAAEAATGATAQFTSAYRTAEQQAQLYADYTGEPVVWEGVTYTPQNPNQGLAAPPGQSRHQSGAAADIAAGPVLDWLHQNAAQFGLGFLDGQAFVNDPGHIQLLGAPQQQAGPSQMPQIPQMMGPDWAPIVAALEAAAPNPVTDTQLADMRIAQALAGAAQGIAAYDWRQDGMARVIASGAAGFLTGDANGQLTQVEMEREDERLRAAHQMQLAELAMQMGLSETELFNENSMRQYQQQMAEYEAGRPQVLGIEGGYYHIQRPDGNLEAIPYASNSPDLTDMFAYLDDIAGAFGENNPLVNATRYSMLFESGADVPQVAETIIRDSINNGLGPVLFGDLYQEELNRAQDNMTVTGDLTPDMEQINNEIAVNLAARLINSQQWSWLETAAAYGNFGAMMLLASSPSYQEQRSNGSTSGN